MVDIIDLIFDEEYVRGETKGCLELDWLGCLNLYKSEFLSSCVFPNSYFESHEELVKIIWEEEGEEKCKLYDYDDKKEKRQLRGLLRGDFWKFNKDLVEQNIDNLAKENLRELEKFISNGNLQKKILEEIRDRENYCLSDEGLETLKKNLYGKNGELVIDVLLNYVVNHEEWVDNKSEIVNFLLDSLKGLSGDKKLYVIKQLLSYEDEYGLDYGKAVYEKLEKFFLNIYAIKISDEKRSELAINLLLGLGNANNHERYEASYELLEYFEQVLVKNDEYYQLALDAISGIMERIIISPKKNYNLEWALDKTQDLLDSGYKLGTRVFKSLVSVYADGKTVVDDLIIRFIGDYINLPTSILSQLVTPVLSRLEIVKSGNSDKDYQELKGLIFIIERLSRYYIELPSDIVNRFSDLLESKDILVRNGAIKLYEQLSKRQTFDEGIKSQLWQKFEDGDSWIKEELIKIFNNIDVTEEESSRLEVEKVILEWSKTKGLLGKVEIAEGFLERLKSKEIKLSLDIAERIKFFFEGLLYRVHYEIFESSNAVLEYLESEGYQVKLVDDSAKARQIYGDSNFANSKNWWSNYVISHAERKSLLKVIEDRGYVSLFENIEFNSYEEATELIQYLDGRGEIRDIIEQSTWSQDRVVIENVYGYLGVEEFQQKANGKIKLYAGYSEILYESVGKLLDSGFKLELLLKMLESVEDNGWILLKVLEKIVDYKVTPEVVDRAYMSVEAIVDNKPYQEWNHWVQRVINDNHFYIKKDIEELIDELLDGNDDNERAKELINSVEIRKTLSEIKKIESNWISHKYLTKELREKPEEYDLNTIYYYERGVERCLGFEGVDKCFSNDNEGIWESLSKVGENKEIIYDIAEEIGLVKDLRHWGKTEFVAWRNSILAMDVDNNIAEVIVVLNQVVRFTNGFSPREIQIIVVLMMCNAEHGMLGQVSTGEGKSLIISMFSAIQVLKGHHVDIVTSSSVLAKRDAEERHRFYDTLGVVVSHNIGGQFDKECYKADVVYGDLLFFIGDVLRDISRNVKFGRGYDILVVDEVDNMFIDQTDMKVQLSSHIAGMETFKGIYSEVAWMTIKFYLDLKEEDGVCYRKKYIIEEDDSGKEPVNFTKLNETEQEEYMASLQQGEEAEFYYEELKNGNTCLEEVRENLIASLTEDLITEKRINGTEYRVANHFKGFVRDQIERWVDSVIMAYFYYEQDKEYIVHEGENVNSTRKIAPVDFSNTGEIQLSLEWMNGLYQYITDKHNLAQKAEGLISIFMSYPSFFLNYKGRIFGLTGTLGSQIHQEFLDEVYEVDTVKVPNYIYKDQEHFDTVIVENEEEQNKEIAKILKRKVADERAGLVIVETIAQAQEVKRELLNLGYNENQVWLYGKGLGEEEGYVERHLNAGDVIVSTNLAGRGTDLKISEVVERNGGLHVILGMFSSSERVEDQAFGRSARKGESGSVQMVLNYGKLQDFDCEGSKDFEGCLKTLRNLHEKESLDEARLCDIREIGISDRLFKEFTELAKKLNTPTGYFINLGNPEEEGKGLEAGSIINVYEESGVVKFIISDSGKKIIKGLDVGNILEVVDPRATKHLLSALKTEIGLNKQDYELIHFIAALHGFTKHDYIVKRVKEEYIRDYSRHVRINYGDNEKIAKEEKTEIVYLHSLLYKSGYEDLLELKDVADEKELAQKIKQRKLYKLWLEDRELYNSEHYHEQIVELWAKWYHEQDKLLYNTECNIYDEEEISKLDERYGDIEKELKEGFGEFEKELIKRVEENKLMENPAYLTKAAWRYAWVNGDKNRRESIVKYISNFEKELHIGAFEKDDVYLIEDNRGSWQWFTDSVTDKLSSGLNNALNSINSAINSVWEGKKLKELYDVPNLLDSAIKFLNEAITLDSVYAWMPMNARSIIKLQRDGQGIVEMDEDSLKKAQAVMQAYADDLIKVIESMYEVEYDAQKEVMVLLTGGMTNCTNDDVLQRIGLVESYNKVKAQLEKNLEVLQKAIEAGNMMIRVDRGIDLVELLNSVNVTEAVNKEWIKKYFYDNEKLTIEQQDAIKEVLESNKFPGKDIILQELRSQGFHLFEIGSYTLKEEKQDWLGVLVTGIMIGVQIGLSVATGGASTVFMNVFSKGLMVGAIGDIFSLGMSIYKGIPIDLNGYFKGKAIGLATTVITAGILSYLDKAQILAYNWAENSRESYNAWTAFTDAASIQVGVSAIGGVLYNVLKKPLVDGENIEDKINRGINSVFNEHRAELQKIFASDVRDGIDGISKNRVEELIIRASEILKKYQKQGESTVSQVGFGSLLNVAGAYLGQVLFGTDLSAIGGHLSGGVNLVKGVIKSEGAARSFLDDFKVAISEVAGSTYSDEDMLSKYLKGRINIGYEAIISGEQSYLSQDWRKDCNGFSNIELIASCEDVNEALSKSYTAESSLRSKVVGLATGSIVNLYKSTLKTGTNEIASEVASGMKGKFEEYLEKQELARNNQDMEASVTGKTTLTDQERKDYARDTKEARKVLGELSLTGKLPSDEELLAIAKSQNIKLKFNGETYGDSNAKEVELRQENNQWYSGDKRLGRSSFTHALGEAMGKPSGDIIDETKSYLINNAKKFSDMARAFNVQSAKNNAGGSTFSMPDVNKYADPNAKFKYSAKFKKPSNDNEQTDPNNPENAWYVVKDGDTLSEIEAKLEISREEMLDYNDIDDVNKIYTGQKLLVSRAKLESYQSSSGYCEGSTCSTGSYGVNNDDVYGSRPEFTFKDSEFQGPPTPDNYKPSNIVNLKDKVYRRLEIGGHFVGADKVDMEVSSEVITKILSLPPEQSEAILNDLIRTTANLENKNTDTFSFGTKLHAAVPLAYGATTLTLEGLSIVLTAEQMAIVVGTLSSWGLYKNFQGATNQLCYESGYVSTLPLIPDTKCIPQEEFSGAYLDGRPITKEEYKRFFGTEVINTPLTNTLKQQMNIEVNTASTTSDFTKTEPLEQPEGFTPAPPLPECCSTPMPEEITWKDLQESFPIHENEVIIFYTPAGEIIDTSLPGFTPADVDKVIIYTFAKKYPDTVEKVGGRYPHNAEYAGQKYPVDKLPPELQEKYPNSVDINKYGFIEFSPYSIKDVKIEVTGNRQKDEYRANKAAGFTKTPDGFTWHHHQDGETMEAVPTDLHKAIRHTGGVAIKKYMKK